MGLLLQPTFQLLAPPAVHESGDVRLDRLMEALDDLHTAAAEGNLTALTGLNKFELIGWLREVIYTASETLDEITLHEEVEATPPKPSGSKTTSSEYVPTLTLLRKSRD